MDVSTIQIIVNGYLQHTVLYEDEVYSSEALFKAGEILLKQTKKEEALSAYEELVEKYPQSTFKGQAEERIQGIHEK